MTSVVPLLEDKRIVICAGSGGVGKTTTSAALAMGMAAQGLRVAVVTIDPAKRLANALGLEQLGNEPHLVEPDRFAPHGIEMRGELSGLIDGFTERAGRVGALLEDPATTFLIVTSPQHDPVEEAIYFHRKLEEAGMPFGGMVVNRVHPVAQANGATPAGLVDELGEALADRVADSAREQAALAARDHAAIEHLEAALHSPPTVR